MKPTYRQIDAFRVVMESGSVTAAADRLYLTQPSVSRLIADLEAAVGFSLFARQGRRLSPTPEAQALYEEVRRSFLGLAEITRVADDIRQHRGGSLTIAAMPALGLQFLPAIVAEYAVARPGLVISLRVRSSPAVLQHVSSQQFDLGFAAIETEAPAVTREELFSRPMLAVLPRGHMLCEKVALTPADFHQQAFVALGSEISTRSETDLFLAHGAARPRIVAEAQLSFVICGLVAGGAGVSIVEPVTARHCSALGMVETRPLVPEQLFRYDVLLPALRPPSRLATEFLAVVRDRAEEAF